MNKKSRLLLVTAQLNVQFDLVLFKLYIQLFLFEIKSLVILPHAM